MLCGLGGTVTFATKSRARISSVSADIDPTDIPNALEYLWHKGADFTKQGAPIPVIFRMATVEDKKRMTSSHTTRRLWVPHDGASGRSRQRGAENANAEEGYARRGQRRRRKREDPEPGGDDIIMMDAGVRDSQSHHSLYDLLQSVPLLSEIPGLLGGDV